MKKSRLISALCAVTISALAFTAHAAFVNPILGLDIGGTLYDVTFHDGISFNALWDQNNNEIFGDDGSLFNSEPTFWGDPTGALAAATAITAALGTVDTTHISGLTDSYFVPYGQTSNVVLGTYDNDTRTNFDSVNDCGACLADNGAVGEFPIASFTLTQVPLPAAVWLFGSGLVGLVGTARRKKAA